MKQIIASFYRNRRLILEMAKRDLKMINKGAFLGYIWLILGPLIQTGAYVIIVSFIFGTSLGGNSGPMDYALYVLGGMIPWQIITKSLAEAPSQIRERMELVKQVIYPIETLPMTSMIVGSFGAAVSFLIFMGVSLFSGTLTWGILLLPVPVVFLVFFLMGVSWIFSIVGIFFKDLREMVMIVLGLMVYLSPVVASPEMVGERIWQLILLNPLSHIVICFRSVYYLEFAIVSWAVFSFMSLATFMLGAWVINRTKLLINQYI